MQSDYLRLSPEEVGGGARVSRDETHKNQDSRSLSGYHVGAESGAQLAGTLSSTGTLGLHLERAHHGAEGLDAEIERANEE